MKARTIIATGNGRRAAPIQRKAVISISFMIVLYQIPIWGGVKKSKKKYKYPLAPVYIICYNSLR